MCLSQKIQGMEQIVFDQDDAIMLFRPVGQPSHELTFILQQRIRTEILIRSHLGFEHLEVTAHALERQV